MLPSHPDDIIEQIQSIEIKTKIRNILNNITDVMIRIPQTESIDPKYDLWTNYHNYLFRFDNEPELINKWAKWLLVRTNVFYEQTMENTTIVHRTTDSLPTTATSHLLNHFSNITKRIGHTRINISCNYEFDLNIVDDLEEVLTLILLSQVTTDDKLFDTVCEIMTDIHNTTRKYSFLGIPNPEDDLNTYVYIRSSLKRLIYYLNKTIY